MKATVAIATVLTAFAVNAFAGDEARAGAEQVINMKDGSTLYIFKNGKMAMEDKVGRAERMNPGQVMETRDGKQIIMIGDEVARLDWLIEKGHGN